MWCTVRLFWNRDPKPIVRMVQCSNSKKSFSKTKYWQFRKSDFYANSNLAFRLSDLVKIQISKIQNWPNWWQFWKTDFRIKFKPTFIVLMNIKICPILSLKFGQSWPLLLTMLRGLSSFGALYTTERFLKSSCSCLAKVVFQIINSNHRNVFGSGSYHWFDKLTL